MNTATEYNAWTATLGDYDTWTAEQRAESTRLFKALPVGERYLVQRERVGDYFTEENRSEKTPFENMSPSGRYRLQVTSYGTKPGSWSYSRGEVFRVSDGEKVADVKRNYSSFWFTWLEDHVDGHDYLACGEDYQGQTFCQLDTGEVRSLIPDEAFEGFGFCWATAELLSDGKTLLVVGCYWACPYERRLYDVSDLMNGWPVLNVKEEGEEDSVASFDDSRGSKLTIDGGRFIWEKGDQVHRVSGESESEMDERHSDAYREMSTAEKKGEPGELRAAYEKMVEEDPDPDEDPEQFEFVVGERITLTREGNVLTVIERWKSEKKAEAERKAAEAEAARKAERQRCLQEDALYAALGEGVDLKGLNGFMIPSYNARHIEGDPNPLYITVRGRPFDPDKSYNHTTQLTWGVVDGPVKLELWVRGKGNQKPEPEFPRTPEGIREAWRVGQAHLAAEGGAGC